MVQVQQVLQLRTDLKPEEIKRIKFSLASAFSLHLFIASIPEGQILHGLSFNLQFFIASIPIFLALSKSSFIIHLLPAQKECVYCLLWFSDQPLLAHTMAACQRRGRRRAALLWTSWVNFTTYFRVLHYTYSKNLRSGQFRGQN
jgi:hypothetical protein